MDENTEPLNRGGRPRQVGLGRRIREVAAQELVASGLQSFSISAVARRGGIAKGSVSLRYPDPMVLAIDALAELFAWDPVPDLGDTRAELTLLADRLVTAAFSPPLAALSQGILAAAMGDKASWRRYLDRILRPGVATARAVLIRANERGDLAEMDVNVVTYAFIGALQFAANCDEDALSPAPALRAALVEMVLAAGQAPSTKSRLPDNR